MARIEVPAGKGGDAAMVWTLRSEMAPAVGELIEAVYHHSRLPTRERELARMRIAQLNGCDACATFRARSVQAEAIDESLYASVAGWRTDGRYTEREQLAIDYAERFAGDHRSIDDEFMARVREQFEDDEIVDLTICVATFVSVGRLLTALGIEEADRTYEL
jgi:AhpD family alkylhydroperoxidase